MSQRVLAILLIALVVSIGASYAVFRLVKARIGVASGPPTSAILVAARSLEIGTLIKDMDVKAGQWVGQLPVGAQIKREDVVGRGVVAAIYEGEPVLETRLAAVGAGAGLAATIPPGMRAVAVRVNDVVGVAGFVVSGMRVDVLITGNPPGAATPAGPKVKTLLQNIQVLSAGQNFQKDSEGKPVQVPVVNLLVTPEQAEILSLASNETRIQLILRNPLDTEPTKTSGTAMANLFNEPKAPAPPSAPRPKLTPVVLAAKPGPPPPFRIEILNGPRHSEVKFDQKVPEEQQ